jgi:hypothetical protein
MSVFLYVSPLYQYIGVTDIQFCVGKIQIFGHMFHLAPMCTSRFLRPLHGPFRVFNIENRC